MAIYRGPGGPGDATPDAGNQAQIAQAAAIEAQGYASNAATSAANAATSYDNFDDRYLGAKASDPTLDNDGNALITGALYFNTVVNRMKVYSGSAWLDGYASGALLAANNLSDVASVSTSRTNLGLGTIATQNANNVSITGGSVSGITDLAIADGGTGASDAPTARTNLGLGTIATQDASSVTITGGSVTGITDLAVADGGTGASSATNAKINLEVITTATGSARIPVGTTAQRDGTPAAGYFRFNDDTDKFEGYNGTTWGSVGGGGATGGGNDDVFYENAKSVTASYTISTNKNAMSTGPITVNSGVVVTIPSGSRWVVI